MCASLCFVKGPLDEKFAIISPLIYPKNNYLTILLTIFPGKLTFDSTNGLGIDDAVLIGCRYH